MSAPPRFDDFKSQLNTKFQARVGEAKPFECELIEARAGASSPKIEVFTLVFRGPTDSPRLTETYSLTHDKLGTMEVFLSPFKADAQGLYYEAVFNRLIESG